MSTTDTRAKDQARAQLDSIMEMVRHLRNEEELDGQDPHERIQEDPLEISIRSDWHCPGLGNYSPSEYRILLCTGGPAVQIIGDLNNYTEPETATLKYQDWFTPWEEYLDITSEENDALLTYAQQFYFGG